MVTNRLLIVSLILSLMACSEWDEFILKEGEDPHSSRSGKMISIAKAKNVIRTYLTEQHIPWGEPTKVRTAPNRYIFNFETPRHELRNRGPRRLIVDVFSGEVSLPITSGGDFSDIQAPEGGQRFMGESRN